MKKNTFLFAVFVISIANSYCAEVTIDQAPSLPTISQHLEEYSAVERVLKQEKSKYEIARDLFSKLCCSDGEASLAKAKSLLHILSCMQAKGLIGKEKNPSNVIEGFLLGLGRL